ncbi:hypothetical protein BUE63_22165 [Bacillus sp. MB353a]|nr:hypothetical protein BUE63_22165 [Bacillus sp. MB353a]
MACCMKIYRRFFEYIYHNLKYIGDSTRNIDLPTKDDNKGYSTFYWNSLVCHQGRYFFHQLVFFFSSVVFSNSSLSST